MPKIKYIIDNEQMMKEWDKIRNDKLGLDPKILSVNYNKGEKTYWISSIHNESYRQFLKNKNLNYAGCLKCKLEKYMRNRNLGYLKRQIEFANEIITKYIDYYTL